MSKCEYCKVELSAGDISVFFDKDGKLQYKVICYSCDKPQSSVVYEVNGMFYVVERRKG